MIRKINLRAAGALLIFLMSWVLAPAAMLAQQPDICSMECCVAEGHCCCAAPKLWVEGQDHSGVQEIGQEIVESSCPYPATPAATSKILSRQATQPSWHSLPDYDLSHPIGRGDESSYRSPRFSTDSSRAPPVSAIRS